VWRVEARLIKVGVELFVLGAIILVAALIANSPDMGGGGTASFGGVILIGPIPIVFGTDRTAVLIGVIGAIILAVVSFVFFFVARRGTAYQRTSFSSMV
jgi:uncharacterized protein (TIGR00304 family)